MKASSGHSSRPGHSLSRRLATAVAVGVWLAAASGGAMAQTPPLPAGQAPKPAQPKTAQPPKPAQPKPAQPKPAQPKAAPDAPNAAQSNVSVFIAAVEGAPGDGAGALSSALKKRLTQRGVKINDGKAKGAYTVKVTVTMGEASSGSQPITIRWLVSEPHGAPMLNALIQRNKVPAGSLDRAWGETADVVAEEAAKALIKMLPLSGK